jgi:beta-carotene 3-hydroxylase
MTQVIINILILVATFSFMEGFAWFLHKYVMHGFLWNLHEDHHIPHSKKFEKNDFFSTVFGIPSWLFIYFGIKHGMDWKLYVGVGIALYGLCYFFIHEVLIHQRLTFLKHTENIYFLALRKAHKVHHKKLNKEDGECFGMLVVPRKYFSEATMYLKRKNEKK